MPDKGLLKEVQELDENGKQIIEKYDVFEPKERVLKEWWKNIIVLTATGACIYQIMFAYGHYFFSLEHRVIHWGFMATLIFLLCPFSRKRSPKERPSFFDITFILLNLGLCAYLFIYSHEIMRRAGSYKTIDTVTGVIFILLVLEAARRSIGRSIPILGIVFILYGLMGPYLPEALSHKGYSIRRLATALALSTEGIFGIPLGVIAQFVFLFILYGAVLQNTGAGKFLTDLAFSLTGTTRGGPAQAAVVSSCFFGMMSGSSVANTVGTGTFTIPLMKKAGYQPHFAGAVEASASAMGQIMPPVMGAGAFIMAEFLSMPYYKVCLAAAIPATLSFLAIFLQVHYRATSMGMRGIPKAELPSFKETLRHGWQHIVSILVLVYIMAQDYSPERAVLWAIIVAVFLSFFKKETRMSTHQIVDTLKKGAVGTMGVAAACAGAGIIIGMITVTGLGLKVSSLVADISMGNMALTLIYTAIVCLIMGCGVPTTASYIIISTLCAPAIIKFGVPGIAAHLFIFYYATRSDVTPPVALTAFSAAAIAGANPTKTAYAAFWLGMAGYIIPFMFIYGTALVMIGSTIEIIWSTITALVGITLLSISVQRCLYLKTTWLETVLSFAGALLLIKTGLLTDAIGFIIGGFVFVSQRRRWKKERRFNIQKYVTNGVQQ